MINLFLYITIFLALHYSHFVLTMLFGLNKLRLQKNDNKKLHKFSVIVPFRNEQENIGRLAESFNHLKYPAEHFEIIFVDDNSDDNSVEEIKKVYKHDNFRILSSENSNIAGHKKMAVVTGIHAAKGEILIATDADCVIKPGWLTIFNSYFNDDTVLVAGPVELINRSTLFQKLQSLEFAGLILAGAGLIGAKNPVICSAANMAYRKEVFLKVDGFRDHLELSSGDDDLFLQTIAREGLGEIKYIFDRAVLVSTNGKSNVDAFMQQRRRWASKSLFYKNNVLILRLFLLALFFVALPLMITLNIIHPEIIPFTIAAIALKVIPDFFVMNRGKNIVYNSSIIKYFLLAELLHIPYLLIASFLGLFGNFNWKGRELKR